MAYWPRTLILMIAAAFLAAAQPATSTKKSALDKATLESYLRHLNVWSPEIQVQIADPKPSVLLPGFQDIHVKASLGQRSIEATYHVSADGQKMVQGNVFDIGANPFSDEISRLKTENQPNIGTPGASAVLVLFSDFQCSYCREEAKTLRSQLIQTYPKEVRLYFKDYPLESIHPWARSASIASRCVYRQKPAAFWDFHDWIFDKQQEITVENVKTRTMEWASSQDLDTLQLGQCIDTRATEAEVNQNIAEGRSLGVNSTPTLFLNGRKLTGKQEWANLKRLIDLELEYQKTAKNAGEDCGCDLSLPNAIAAAPASSVPIN